ncbi:MAG: anthranilate phosphoribosyltransferase, partial [Phycisphaerales bacterium]|nr:anthranilate phosphoribosyltransferase [Phycisphaerales bacterium]
RSSLTDLRGGRSLSEDGATRMMTLILAGRVEQDELVRYLELLAAKGASIDELVGSVRALRRIITPLNVPFEVMDTCGTGGDRSATFNISTVAALVTAAAGQPVAKHGNRSSSGGIGSADVIEALGLSIDSAIDTLIDSLHRHRFAFLFAPRFRPKAAQVGEARRRVRGPTLFNLVGPLCNPARPAFQVIGTFSESAAQTLAEATLRLGTRRTFVVAGPGGVDELIPLDQNVVFEVVGGGIHRHVFRAENASVQNCELDALRGGNAKTNAHLAKRILAGQRGAPRDAVVMNAGLALFVAGRAESLRDGCEQCASIIDRGIARDLLETLRNPNDGPRHDS